ncbi:hypothetical protein, partial [Enterococcus avium]|uniref:hypothetical protein n=1 Tax=Enterococcus avium TaxID=33945 RepID=UPI002E110D06
IETTLFPLATSIPTAVKTIRAFSFVAMESQRKHIADSIYWGVTRTYWDTAVQPAYTERCE